MSVTAAARGSAPTWTPAVSVPWRIGDFVVTYVANLVAAVMLLAAWWGSSTRATAQSQLVWVDLAVAGLVVAGTSNGLWVLHGRRAVSRRTHLVGARLASSGDAAGPPPAAAVDDDALVAAPVMTRFHRDTCPLVAGKPVNAAGRSTHELANRRPCGVCRP